MTYRLAYRLRFGGRAYRLLRAEGVVDPGAKLLDMVGNPILSIRSSSPPAESQVDISRIMEADGAAVCALPLAAAAAGR